jgi:hypothetical protein
MVIVPAGQSRSERAAQAARLPAVKSGKLDAID